LDKTQKVDAVVSVSVTKPVTTYRHRCPENHCQSEASCAAADTHINTLM